MYNNKNNKMQYNYNNNILVSIEGNIGSGKSTLLEKCKNIFGKKNIVFLQEPVGKWETIKDENGIAMIEKFYENQEKYGFSFQMMAFTTRLADIKRAFKENTNSIIISERSLYTDRYVFAQMLYDDKKIENVNFQIYLQCYEEFIVDFPVEFIIYVKTNPLICHERIMKRARIGEDVIPIEYLTNCHKYHESFLETMTMPKLVLDGNQSIFENPSVLDSWFEKITSLLSL